MKSRDLNIQDTSDLRTFMLELKAWAHDHQEPQIYDCIQRAEARGFSASELLHEYTVALQEIREKFWNYVPENFRASVERGIEVARDAVNLGSYTYKQS